MNSQTKPKINVDDLTEEEKKFYRQALEQFKKNIDWLSFDEFAFGPKSPIYSRRRSHLDVLKDHLYVALKEISLQLGIQQGMIAQKQGERDTRGLAHRSSSLRSR